MALHRHRNNLEITFKTPIDSVYLMTKPIDYKGLIIRESKGSGKSGKDQKFSSSIQILEPHPGGGGVILATKRFLVGDMNSRARAIRRAKQYIDGIKEENHGTKKKPITQQAKNGQSQENTEKNTIEVQSKNGLQPLIMCDSPVWDFDFCPRKRQRGCEGCSYLNDMIK